MKFRSWYIVLLGIIVQLIFGALLISAAKTPGIGWGGLALIVAGYAILLSSTIGIIPLILLIFEKTRKIGAMISIIFGIGGIILGMGALIGILLIIAGIIALWKGI